VGGGLLLSRFPPPHVGLSFLVRFPRSLPSASSPIHPARELFSCIKEAKVRKNIVPKAPPAPSAAEGEWLDLERLAQVEVTSEDAAHPVESALLPDGGPGWRADRPGEQTLRVIFDAPQRLRRIRLRFEDSTTERRQEFVLRWSDDGEAFREIVRQQWNFSPTGATSETEDYQVDLPAVTALELTVIPDVSGGDARASLAELRLA